MSPSSTFLIHPLPVSSLRTRLSGLGLGLLGLGSELAADLDALEEALTVLVELELGDDDVAGVDAEGDRGTGGLLAGDTLDVDNVLEAVHRGDLTLLVLVGATDNLDLVVLADGDAADLMGRAESATELPGEDVSPRRKRRHNGDKGEQRERLTLYFSRSSLERGALMMLRRSPEEAWKCALRDLLREEWRAVHGEMSILIFLIR